MKKRLFTFSGVLVLAAALFTVIYYIWSNLYIAEFDADNAETVLWAQTTIESGRLVDPDYRYYSVLIPLGGNVFFIPFVKAFGVGMTALRSGFTVYSVLFAFLLLLFLRSCLPNYASALCGTGCVLLFTLATEELRDIFWAHMVYYGLSAFFILMCFCSLALYLRGKHTAGGILLFLSALLGSMNGNAILLYTVLPLAAAVFLESLRRERPSEGFLTVPFILICAAVVAGVGLNTWICAGMQTSYSDQYTQFAPASRWIANLRQLPERWLSLFLDLPGADVPIMSSVGVKLALRLCAALVCSLFPFFSFSLLKRGRSRLTRIIVLYHWILCALLLFLFACGTISNYSRRLIPLFFSSLIVDWLTAIWLWKENGFRQTAAVSALGMMLFFAGITGVSVTRQPGDLSVWYGPGSVYRTLEDHGLTRGYSTNYWYANSVTVLSNESIISRSISIADDVFEIPPNQNKGAWYEGTPSEEKTFLVCFERELALHPWLEKDAVGVLRATQYTPMYDMTEGYFILIYDRDVIAENLL